MRRILVTAVSGDIGNCITEILIRAGEEVYACDINSVVPCMDTVRAFYQSVYAVDPGYMKQLTDACREYGITHLIPTNEREIEVVSAHRSEIEELGVKLIIQSEYIVKNCLDKYLTMQLLADAGFDVPAFGINTDELEDCRFIVKGRKSNGSKDIMIFNSKAEFSASGIDIADEYILQKYIEGDEFTLGVFASGDVVKSIAFKRTLNNGHSHQVELVSDSAFDDMARRAAKLFNLEGYINLQMRLCDGRYYIFEINPRISGTVGFRDKLGFTDVLWWLDLVDGRDTFSTYEQKLKKAVGIRYLAEKFVCLE